MKTILLSALFFVTMSFASAQDYYFPERNADWELKSPKEAKFDADDLQKAVNFAEENEYSGSRDLRIAILEGFAREPFHEILGPTKSAAGRQG
jgi:hypothetical protein